MKSAARNVGKTEPRCNEPGDSVAATPFLMTKAGAFTAEAVEKLVARLRVCEEVAELADHYTDMIAQAKPVDYGDEAWLLLVGALNKWRPGARQE